MERMAAARRIAAALKERGNRLSRLEWVQYTTGFDFGVVQAEREYTAVLKDRKNFRTIERLRQRNLDPLDRRRLEIIYLHFKPFHLSAKLNKLDDRIRAKTVELSQVLNNFRFRLDGREVRGTEIAQILRSEPDRKRRRQAFLARSQINQPLVKAGFLDLIKMRRDFAHLYGARDFVAYMLERNELEDRVFDRWPEQAAELRPAREKMNAELGRRYLGDERVMPWDTAYIEYRLAPQLDLPVDLAGFYRPLRQFFLILGFDLDRYDITYDLFPRKHKSEWGYNFTIEEGRDSRVLANMEGRFHELGVLLHETGHALHSYLLDPEDIMLNLGISGIVAEGLANLCGDLQYHRRFFSLFFQQGLREMEDSLSGLQKYEKANAFVAMSGILFDQELYRREIESLEDIHQLYWRIHAQILNEAPYAEQPVWAYRIHHTTHPIYLHNYFLGDLTNQMLREVFCRRHRIDDPLEKPRQFGRFLYQEVIKPSGRYPFLDLFEKISGRAFSLEYLKDRPALKKEARFGKKKRREEALIPKGRGRNR